MDSSFVILILADLFGRPPKGLPRLRDRRPVTVTRGSFDSLLARGRSTLAVSPEFPNSPADPVNLRSSWLGLKRLADAMGPLPYVTVKIWDVSKAALLRDLYMAPSLEHSTVFKRVYSDGLGTFGSAPVGLIIGDFDISPSAEDCELVGMLAFSGAPLLCGVTPAFLSCSRWDEVGNADFAGEEDSRLPRGWPTQCGHAESRFLFPLLPRWRSGATREGDRPWLHPGYLVAIRVVGAMQARTFGGAIGNLFHKFSASSLEYLQDYSFLVIDSLWDVESEWNCEESQASMFQKMGLNLVSDSMIRSRDLLETLVSAGHMARPKSHETLAKALLLGGTAQQLRLCVRQKRRSDSGVALIAAITDWSRTQVPRDSSGEPLLQVKHVAISLPRVDELTIAVAWHPAAGGGIEQIKLQVPGIRDHRSEWFAES